MEIAIIITSVLNIAWFVSNMRNYITLKEAAKKIDDFILLNKYFGGR